MVLLQKSFEKVDVTYVADISGKSLQAAAVECVVVEVTGTSVATRIRRTVINFQFAKVTCVEKQMQHHPIVKEMAFMSF